MFLWFKCCNNKAILRVDICVPMARDKILSGLQTFSIASSRKAFLVFSRLAVMLHRLISTLVLLLLSWVRLEERSKSTVKWEKMFWYQANFIFRRVFSHETFSLKVGPPSIRFFNGTKSAALKSPPPLTNKFRRPIDAKVINCHNIRGFPIPCVAHRLCENYLSSRLRVIFTIYKRENNKQALAQNDFMTFRRRLSAKSTKKNYGRITHEKSSCNSMTFFWNLFIFPPRSMRE